MLVTYPKTSPMTLLATDDDPISTSICKIKNYPINHFIKKGKYIRTSIKKAISNWEIIIMLDMKTLVLNS